MRPLDCRNVDKGDNMNGQSQTIKTKLITFLLNNKSMLLVIIAIIVAACVSPHFLTYQNIRNILRQNATYCILGFGFTCIMASGNIDLSVGYLTGLLGIIIGYLDTLTTLPLPVIILIAMVIGAGLSFVNAFIGTVTHIQMFIVTLATGQIFKGICYVISDNSPVIGLSEGIRTMAQGYLFGQIPVAVIIMAVFMVLIWLFISKTIYGRWAVAMGGNKEASRVSGINTFWVTVLVYVILGICCTFAALILAGRSGSAQPTAGDGMEMDCIAAVVIGGTAMSGGKANVAGTFFGVILVGLLTNIFNLLGLDTNLQYVLKGVLILVAVMLDRLSEQYFTRQLKTNV